MHVSSQHSTVKLISKAGRSSGAFIYDNRFFLLTLKYFLFLVVTISCLISVNVNASQPNVSSSQNLICKFLIGYKICGTNRVYQQQFSEFGNVLDFRKAENVAHQQVIAVLKRSDPDVVVNQLPYNDNINMEWVSLINRISRTFSFDSMALSKFSGFEKINPTYKAMFEVAKRKQVLLRVNLNTYPDFLTIDKNRVYQVCKKSYKLDDIYRSYSPSRLSKEIEKCYKLMTGNLEQAWKVNDPRAVKTVYFTMVSMWGALLIGEELKQYFSKYPRKVYMVSSKTSLSPRVNSMGNLYMPARISSKRSRMDVKLILLHESAHVHYFTFERLVKLMLSYLPKILKEADEKKFEQELPKIRKLLHLQGMMQEFRVDMHVLTETFQNRKKRYRYQELIGEIEQLYPERAKAIGILNELSDTLNDPQLLMIFMSMAQMPENQDREALFTPAQIKLAARYNQVYIRYVSALQAGHILTFENTANRRIDPMELEEQLVKTYSKLYREYERISRH